MCSYDAGDVEENVRDGRDRYDVSVREVRDATSREQRDDSIGDVLSIREAQID